ncbi:MAG: PorT family protein [Chitinophagaceae bacterium]|nr:PorT family protein [Chitinophagaceae bacterium]
MRRTLILCASLLAFQLVHISANSQSFIVTAQNDTIRGVVEPNFKNKNPTKIKFSGGTSTAEYTPGMIKSFFVDEENFVSNDSVFLKVLVQGPKSLYYLKHTDLTEQFFILDGGVFKKLLYSEYDRTDDQGKTVRVSLKTYVDQLKVYLGDNPAIENKISKVELKYNKLIDLFDSYYAGSKSKVSTRVVKQTSRVEIGVLAGVTSTIVKFANPNYTIESSNGSTDFTGGVSADIFLPGRFTRVSFANDLMYTSFDVTVSNRSNATDYYVVRSSRIEATYIKLYSMLRYRFPFEKSYFFLNGGMSNDYAVNIEDAFTQQTIRNGVVEGEMTGKVVPDTRKFEVGYVLGAGAGLGKVSLQFRFEKGNGVSKFENFQTNSRRLFLLAGYRFGK